MILFNASPTTVYPIDHDWILSDLGPGNTILTENTFIESTQDGPMPVYTVRNLTLEAGIILTPQVRCKGCLIRVAGNLHMKAGSKISMTARGASAVPDDLGIDFWQGKVDILSDGDSTGHYAKLLGKYGGAGAARVYTANFEQPGLVGSVGVNGACGGGGSGASVTTGTASKGYSGAGAQGTVYSGGPGGGAININYADNIAKYGNNGAVNGGAGGNGLAYRGNAAWIARCAGGGAGNNGGTGSSAGCTGNPGQTGTGGLLIIMVMGKILIETEASLESNGSHGGSSYSSGGGSGAGAIHVFHGKDYKNFGAINVNGGRSNGTYSYTTGGKGGDGSSSVTFMQQTAG